MSSSEASFIKMKRKKISSSHLQLVYAQTTADDRCLKPASLFAFFGGFLNSPSSIEDCRTTDSTIDGCDERLRLAQSSGRRYLSCVADIIHHRIPNSSRVWWKRATKKKSFIVSQMTDDFDDIYLPQAIHAKHCRVSVNILLWIYEVYELSMFDN